MSFIMYLVPVLYLLTSIVTLGFSINAKAASPARSSELKYDYPTLTLFYGIFCIIAFVRNLVGSFWECGCYDRRLVCGRNLTDGMDDDEEGHYNATSTRCFGRSNDGLTYSSNSNKMNYSQFIRPDFLILGIASIVSSYHLERSDQKHEKREPSPCCVL